MTQVHGTADTPVSALYRAEGAVLRAGESWPADSALLLLTYSKNEKYVAPARENLALFWPNHPRLHVVTDGALTGEDVICRPGLRFAELLRRALDEVRTRQPGVRYVYLLLEDLVPLGPVDEPYLLNVEHAMRDHGGLFFSTLCRGSGKQSALPLASDQFGALAETLGLRRLNAEASAYNCLVACFWDVGYLTRVLDAKLSQGQTSPWQFETPDPEVMEPHVLAEDCWPTFRSGFLKLGAHSKHLDRPHGFPASPLLAMLQAEYRSEGTLADRARKALTRWERHARAALMRRGGTS